HGLACPLAGYTLLCGSVKVAGAAAMLLQHRSQRCGVGVRRRPAAPDGRALLMAEETVMPDKGIYETTTANSLPQLAAVRTAQSNEAHRR
ncbi:MAG: hypothetical protein ACXVCO_19790, partial [Ktedonobacterales bacterium]